MPELPEVEVVRRTLEPRLVGRRLVSAHIHRPSLREPLDRGALRALAGRRVEAVRRRAKYLLLDIEGEAALVIHLGMTGQLTVAPAHAPLAAHEHVGFGLEDGHRLRFVDPRRFGQVFTLARQDLEADRHFVHLGVEPLEDGFHGPYLQARARGRRGPIKSFLMDGRIVVGVGNIYASEALWRAGVHPRRSVARVSAVTWERLAMRVREVLGAAIEEGGTTLADFADGEGNAGYFQVSLDVYGRAGQACRRCGGPIRRLVQAGRSSFYCAGCQR